LSDIRSGTGIFMLHGPLTPALSPGRRGNFNGATVSTDR